MMHHLNVTMPNDVEIVHSRVFDEVRLRLVESGANRDAAVQYDKLDAFLGGSSRDGTPGSRVGPAL